MFDEFFDGLMEFLRDDLLANIKRFLNWGLHWNVGEGKAVNLTIGLVITLIVAYWMTRFLLKWLRRLLTRRMKEEDKLKFNSVFSFVNYTIYLTVIMITLSAAGINVTVLLTASAALFVGLGLALQILFQDIIGGIVIIVDKSLLVGDIVEVDDKVGKVFEIKLRTTRAITRDDKVIVIPNHKFITDSVYNYTQNHRTTREAVSVGVAYGSDVEKVTRILLEAAAAAEDVLNNPKPFVLFDDFGDSALLFSLNFFVDDGFKVPQVKSGLRYTIDARFREEGVTIPFPQRDVHLYSRSE